MDVLSPPASNRLTTMPELYPLRFEPIFRHYLWGGRRLESVLGKTLADDQDRYAESWEIVDHGDDVSQILNGPWAGRSLRQVVQEAGQSLFGRHAPRSQFPLLFKFLDAHRTLSVQVHPNDQQAARLKPPDLGKTEAWVVLAAEPGSKIYAGLKRGFDEDELRQEVNRGTSHLCLHQFEPVPGDCVFIPAGTVHALGEGLVVAEIQQASDTTYRLFDWGRVDASGASRPLHIAEALQTIDYDRGPVDPQVPQSTDRPHVQRLVRCDKFVLDRWKLTGTQPLASDDRFHFLVVLQGEVTLAAPDQPGPLAKGQTALIPASTAGLELTSENATLLDIYLP